MPRSASLAALRDAVEARRQMQQRDLAERRRLPVRRRPQRVVDLHVALAVAVAARRPRAGAGGGVRRRRAAGRRAGSASTEQITPARAVDRLAAGQPHAGGAPAPSTGDHGVDIGAGADRRRHGRGSALEGGEQSCRAALHDRRAGRFEREGDDLRHLRRNRRSPARARVCSTHGANSARTSSDS